LGAFLTAAFLVEAALVDLAFAEEAGAADEAVADDIDAIEQVARGGWGLLNGWWRVGKSGAESCVVNQTSGPL
jgi:hypothetical protein